MASTTLPASTFTPSARDRVMERNTVIEDTAQVSVRRAHRQKHDRLLITSPMSDDFPTPKASTLNGVVQTLSDSDASSDTLSDDDSMWSKRSSSSEFDDMYDVTENESEGDVPIKLSRSVKRRIGSSRPKQPSLVIPSPSEWPSIDKMKSATLLSPPIKIDIAPEELAQQQERSCRVPSTSSPPSLDGSATSEELANSTCPSTPSLSQHEDGDNAWDVPLQLDPSSISMLEQINGEERYDSSERVLEVPEGQMREMVESPPVTGSMRLDTKNLSPASSGDADDELSALSVPSPGGFFASLDSSVARQKWAGTEPTPTTSTATEFYGVPFGKSSRASTLPTSSTATSFYGVPWTERPNNAIEHTVSLDAAMSERDPVTARKGGFSPTEVIQEVDEIDETYDNKLEESAAANLDRTQLWLQGQNDYMKAVCEDTDVVDSFKDVEDAVPKTPEQPSPRPNDLTSDSPSKKSVRFADAVASPKSSASEPKRASPIHDGTFWDGWRHQKRSARARDVFQHRQARAEAEHVRRTSNPSTHAAQLRGHYELLDAPTRPNPSRPISTCLPSTTDDDSTETILTATREREALAQLQTSSWHLAATRSLHGGRLLTSPLHPTFSTSPSTRILDLAGQVHCAWAWDVALEHPHAQVYTTLPTDAEAHVASASHSGPPNHHVVAAPCLWDLPFASNTFDVISARNLHAHLKTSSPNQTTGGEDEYSLTLTELHRLLKPGGYLEFDLLDAELLHPSPAAHSLGVEFAFNLRTRGYDPAAGRSFLPRLKRAGFAGVKRAWMVLPCADVVSAWTDAGSAPRPTAGEKRIDAVTGDVAAEGVTGSVADVRAVSGLIGARLWEGWQVKLAGEMGRDEGRVVEGVGRALAEAGREGGCGWRCLIGWARKE